MANILISFQNLKNKILMDIINLGIINYIDITLVYSPTKVGYKKLIKGVFGYLQKWNLTKLIDKIEF
jgi:hypothetical protein